MRLYSFVNHYLSPLQQGVHTAHCVAEMANTVASLQGESTMQCRLFFEWASKHKTIDIRVGGDARMLDDIWTRLYEYSEKFGLPLVKSYEDGNPANEKLTAVAVLVPEWAYNAKMGVNGEKRFWVWNHSHLNIDRDMPSSMSFYEGTMESELIGFLNSTSLV